MCGRRGQYIEIILQAAGGAVVDLHGEPISLDLQLGFLIVIVTAMYGRRKFVARGSRSSARTGVGSWDIRWILGPAWRRPRGAMEDPAATGRWCWPAHRRRATTMAAKPTTVQFVVHSLTADRSDDLVEVFGPNGAYGGCWCMDWRVPRDVYSPGESNQRRPRSLVDRPTAPGLRRRVQESWTTVPTSPNAPASVRSTRGRDRPELLRPKRSRKRKSPKAPHPGDT